VTGGLGGAAAIGTTPPLLIEPDVGGKLVGVLPAVEPPFEAVVEGGDSELLALCVLADVGVVDGVWCSEFLRLAFFDARVDAPPTGIELPLPLFRFLMTSVFKDSGRTTPWSFKKSPHALQRGCPSGFLRHNGVVCVKQFVQVVGCPFAP
jgi:hypothetical protein